MKIGAHVVILALIVGLGVCLYSPPEVCWPVRVPSSDNFWLRESLESVKLFPAIPDKSLLIDRSGVSAGPALVKLDLVTPRKTDEVWARYSPPEVCWPVRVPWSDNFWLRESLESVKLFPAIPDKSLLIHRSGVSAGPALVKLDLVTPRKTHEDWARYSPPKVCWPVRVPWSDNFWLRESLESVKLFPAIPDKSLLIHPSGVSAGPALVKLDLVTPRKTDEDWARYSPPKVCWPVRVPWSDNFWLRESLESVKLFPAIPDKSLLIHPSGVSAGPALVKLDLVTPRKTDEDWARYSPPEVCWPVRVPWSDNFWLRESLESVKLSPATLDESLLMHASGVSARPALVKLDLATPRTTDEDWVRIRVNPIALHVTEDTVGKRISVVKLSRQPASAAFVPLAIPPGLGAVNVPSTPPAATTFKPNGYVENAAGQLEAIIVLDDAPQILRVGDLISGRYRVTRITPDSVDSVSEPPAPPERLKAGSLGYVQMANGKVESVMADGSSVRLDPEAPPATMAQVSPLPPQQPQGLLRALTTPIGVASFVSEAVRRSLNPTKASMVPVVEPDRSLGETDRPFADTLSVSGGRTDDKSSFDQLRVTSNNIAGEEESLSADAHAAPAMLADQREVLPNSEKPYVTMKPLGFVVKGNGEFAAILSDNGEIYIVRQGDRFGEHYRALNVSADAVEAVDDAPMLKQPLPYATPARFPDALASAADQEGLPRLHVSARPKSVAALKTSPQPAVFIFQTLGYVETHSGGMRAVVAEGAEVYLVRRGEVFAQRYLATSVDPAVVLAVKASRAWDAENRSYAQAERISNPASNQADKYLQFPLPGLPSLQAANQLGSGNQFLTALGLNLLRSSLTGLGVRTHFGTAENPSVLY